MKPEWLSFFQVASEEEALDAYDQALFEVKKYFLQKPWLRLTAQSKLKQLHAISNLEGDMDHENSTIEPPPFESLLKWWNTWQVQRNIWRKNLVTSNSATEMVAIIEKGMECDRVFSAFVPELDWTDETPIFGIEPDVMEIQKEFMRLEQLEIRTFASLYETKASCSKSVLVALKRFSLLSNYL